MKRFCAQAGFTGNFTNHSGKVTCATNLFSQNFDEQLIQRQTGHRSDAVRAYKRPSTSHNIAVSDALQPPPSKRDPVETKENIPSASNLQYQLSEPSSSMVECEGCQKWYHKNCIHLLTEDEQSQ